MKLSISNATAALFLFVVVESVVPGVNAATEDTDNREIPIRAVGIVGAHTASHIYKSVVGRKLREINIDDMSFVADLDDEIFNDVFPSIASDPNAMQCLLDVEEKVESSPELMAVGEELIEYVSSAVNDAMYEIMTQLDSSAIKISLEVPNDLVSEQEQACEDAGGMKFVLLGEFSCTGNMLGLGLDVTIDIFNNASCFVDNEACNKVDILKLAASDYEALGLTCTFSNSKVTGEGLHDANADEGAEDTTPTDGANEYVTFEYGSSASSAVVDILKFYSSVSSVSVLLMTPFLLM